MSTKIHYIEMPTSDLTVSKRFYSEVFGWSFQDFGDSYTVIQNAGIDAGFYAVDNARGDANAMLTATGSALVVLYADDLPTMQQQIIAAGGKIVVETFAFPGGCRFHFKDPCGNELAVWSEMATVDKTDADNDADTNTGIDTDSA